MMPAAGLERRAMTIGGVERTYWVAPLPLGDLKAAPVLIVLHGGGGQGPGMAALTGLADRGPAAGFVTVFPDGHRRVWNDARDAPGVRRRAGIDDVAFLKQIFTTLTASGCGGGLFLAGMSNGAFMAEHVARQALLPVRGVALVAGPGTERSRATMRRPAQRSTVVIFAGDEDPLVPYHGGPITVFGRAAARRAEMSGSAPRGLAVAAESAAGDWAAGNGITSPPTVERFAGAPGDAAVTRMTWSTPGSPFVTLFRLHGAGHVWPGGAAYLPPRLIGRTTRSVDATAQILELFAKA